MMKLSQQFNHRIAPFAALPILVGALFFSFSVAASAQANITVTTQEDELNADGDCSLREAIEAANRDRAVDGCPAGSGYDTIEIGAGVYTVTLAGAGEDANQTGDFDITSGMRIQGAGVAGTQLVGAFADRIFHIQPGAAVNIEGMTMRDGRPADAEVGGAVLNEGILEIRASVISGNRSGDGQDCIGVVGPCAPLGGDGGGIYSSGGLTMTATIVSDNRTGKGGTDDNNSLPAPQGRPDGNGGGVFNAGTLVLLQCEIAANQGWNGAGVYNKGRATIVETTILRNQTTIYDARSIFGAGNSSGRGGGLANEGGVLELRNSAVYDNFTPDGTSSWGGSHGRGGWGGDGGGIYSTGVMTCSNSTIAGNHTGAGGDGTWGGGGGDGGAIDNTGTLVLNNMTIIANRTGTGGKGLLSGGDPDGVGAGVANFGTVRIKNTLLADNWSETGEGTVASDCGGDQLTSQGYNLISAPECSGASAPSDRLGTAAQVGPFGDYGGPTWTYPLLKVSPAIDAGSCTDTELRPVNEDQRGTARPQIDNCDIGAYEATQVDLLHYAFLPVCRR